MKVSTEEESIFKVTLELTAKEAEILKAMIQNPIWADEDAQAAALRGELFGALFNMMA